MLIAIIPTLNAVETLPALLRQLEGGVDVVIVSDGASADKSIACALKAGTGLATGGAGRGAQLLRGARWAGMIDMPDWFLFLHADSVLPQGWAQTCRAHIKNHPDRAGYFGLRFDSPRLGARFVEKMAALRSAILTMPYGDQGLLISRTFYEAVGGYPDWPLFEDVGMVERIVAANGRRGLKRLAGKITTSAARYEAEGFLRRGWSNWHLYKRHRRGACPADLARDYR